MKKIYDVAVVGLGAMGSAALYQLAKRGAKVIGIDQFHPPHQLGSSAGETRVTRQAIGEGVAYTPFAIRSNQIWREVEAQTGEDLLTQCGVLVMTSYSTGSEMHGSKDFLLETISAAKRFGIQHFSLDVGQIKSGFPQFNLVGDERGYYEFGGGFLRPENCIRAQMDLAQKYDAHVSFNARVEKIFAKSGQDAFVKMADGTKYHADKIIITAGAWVYKLLKPKYIPIFTVNRQVLYWFDAGTKTREFEIGKFPVFIWMTNGGFIYGFPAIDGPEGGVKVASEENLAVDPDAVKREVFGIEAREMYRREVRERLPGLSLPCAKACVCLYTKTPDSGFIIDFDPDSPNMIIASPCSGHGFKHSAAVGETLAQMALDGKSRLDISPFTVSRFLK